MCLQVTASKTRFHVFEEQRCRLGQPLVHGVLFDGGCFGAERYGVHSFRVCQLGSREWAGLVAPQSARVALIHDVE